MSFDAGNIVAHIKADTVNFQNGIRDAQRSTDSFGSGMAKAGKAVAAGLAVASVAAVAFGVSSVKAYAEAEKASKQLEHAVVDVSKATKAQLKETEDLADALEKKGVLDGDNIKMGLAQLSTFGLSNKAVQALGGSLSDLAVNQFGVNASGEQLSDTANMIAKALNGQFGILEKSGIRFNAAQKHAIEFGTEMEKVDAINQGFAQNLKFTNDVALTTWEGKLAKIGVSFENIKESIGGVIVTAITPLAASLSNFVASDQFQAWVANLNAWIAINLPIAIAWLRDEGLPALKAAFDAVWPVVQVLAGLFVDFIGFINDHQWVLKDLIALFVAVKVAMFLEGAVAAFQAAMTATTVAFNGMKTIVSGPIALTILAGAALLVLDMVYKKFLDTKAAMEGSEQSIQSSNRAREDAIQGLNAIAKGRSPGNVEAAKKTLHEWGVPGYAKGVQDFAGGLAYVHQGEVLANLPKGTDVIPRNKVDSMMGGISNTIGSIVINKDVDGEMWLSKLTRNDELIAGGMSTL